jgi:hypothetical protein
MIAKAIMPHIIFASYHAHLVMPGLDPGIHQSS